VRESVGHLVTGNGTAVDQLAAAANRRGVREADCEDCGGAVDVALLREPACPHCGATFADVEASSGWFGSDTLVTGAAPPALEPAADLVEEESDVAAIADGETDD
jgi:hypothetical protein